MSAYVRVLRSIWQDSDFRSLTIADQRLYLLLISQPDISHVGVLPLMPGRWARLAAGSTVDSIQSSLDRLAVDNFVVVDEESGEVWVRTYIQRDEVYKLTNGKKSLVNAYNKVHSQRLQRLIAAVFSTVDVTVTATVDATVWLLAKGNGVGEGSYPTVDVTVDSTVDVTVEAIELLVAHRVATTAKSNPDGLRRALRRDLPGEHAAALNAYRSEHPEADAWALAVAVLGVPQPVAAAVEMYVDPHCGECDGYRIKNFAPEGAPAVYGDCPCLRSEPYPEALATVTDIRAVV